MVDEPDTAAIRSFRWDFPALSFGLGGVALGLMIAAGGIWLADRQVAQFEAQLTASSIVQKQLLDALREARVTGPRLRLEELANLPLMPEYLALHQAAPGSLDARELKSYLTSVLEAALPETGLAHLRLETAGGAVLIDVSDPLTPKPETGTMVLHAVVSDFSGEAEPAGQLIGRLPSADLKLLATEPGSPGVTAAIGAKAGAGPTGLAQTTRTLGLIGGFGCALLGLAGAYLLRRRRTGKL